MKNPHSVLNCPSLRVDFQNKMNIWHWCKNTERNPLRIQRETWRGRIPESRGRVLLSAYLYMTELNVHYIRVYTAHVGGRTA
jgi:hypothetical protein